MRLRQRPRKYPWIFESRTIPQEKAPICEACDRKARWHVEYEPSRESMNLLGVNLCERHEKLARTNHWDVVFRDWDKKVEMTTEIRKQER